MKDQNDKLKQMEPWGFCCYQEYKTCYPLSKNYKFLIKKYFDEGYDFKKMQIT